MKVTLIRHGETEDNYLQKVQGRSNNLLNDTGRRQCLKVKDQLKNKNFDVCYMSPLARCVETAIILIGDRVKTVPDQRLVERDMGELEGQQFGTYDYLKYWNYDLNDKSFGVESIHDLFARVDSFYQMLLDKHENQNILVVTHGATYRAFRCLINKKKLEGNLYDSSIKNCQWEEFEI